MRAVVLAGALLLSLAGPPAAAQAPAGPPPTTLGEDASVTVSELLVVARPPGPAMWRVRRGGSELVVLGTVRPVPHSLDWNQRRVARALDGAHHLLLGPVLKAGPVDTVRVLAREQGRVKQPRGRTLEAGLPRLLRLQFEGARKRALQGPERYAGWKPAVAGYYLLSDYRQAAGLSEAKPDSTLERLAKARRVRTSRVAEYRLVELLRSAGGLDAAGHEACLQDALEQNQAEADSAIAVARAWADGDLAAVKASYRPGLLESCLARVSGGATLLERRTADTTRALAAALDRPGRTVAAVDLSLLLRRDGVLDRLRAAGAEVSAPLEY
jgi:hypothetical protein